ncbi:hypothetical protein [Arthrobacter sp. CJ23]|uniref:hypothetical protein n=1 Tax=Arthrobacter sp. CJ23 TaxID=2972479 RepID=UPI00215C02A6|nr:hypothetical protein [Arthrobacter sp. CJ23]UVJ39510.1 hypothetical protein NVV90_20315 [Arthrobacter sp. CJ23]
MPRESRPGNDEASGSARPEPEYGVRLPAGPEHPLGAAAGTPAWHPEAYPQQAPLAQPHRPAEDVGRGTLLALAVVPLGIIVWMILWKFGWITSLVTFGAAALAARFYVLGTGGVLSRKGVWIIAGVTAATAILSFVGGVWLDAVEFLGGSPLARVFDPEPWALMGDNLMYNPDFVSGYMGDFLMALLFGALGCFFTLRRLFASTKNV